MAQCAINRPQIRLEQFAIQQAVIIMPHSLDMFFLIRIFSRLDTSSSYISENARDIDRMFLIETSYLYRVQGKTT